MQKATIALTSLVQKKNVKIEYVISNCSYGDYRKLSDLDCILTGTATIVGENIEYDKNAKKLCRHVKVKDMKNTPDEKSHSGYIVCEAKNIPALTKAINDFYALPQIKELGLTLPFSLLRTCEQFTGDCNVKATEPAYINEAIPAE